MKASLVCLLMLIGAISHSQKIQYNVKASVGSGAYFQKDYINYAEELDIVEIFNQPSYNVGVNAFLIPAKRFWQPGISVGVNLTAFDLILNGSANKIKEYAITPKANSNDAYINYNWVSYFQFAFSNKFLCYQHKNFRISPFINAGFNQLYKGALTLEKLDEQRYDIPEFAFLFFNNFKSHLFVESGAEVSLFRNRLGISLSYGRNITPVYENDLISSLTQIQFGAHYNFANLNIQKFRARENLNTDLKILNRTKSWTFGLRLNLPIYGQITTTGKDFPPSENSSHIFIKQGYIFYKSGNFYLSRDFPPILPGIYIRRNRNKIIDLEAALGFHAHYYSINYTTITPTTQFTQFQTVTSWLYFSSELNSIIKVLRRQEHQLAAIVGFSYWKDFTNDNLSTLLNANLGLQYSYNKLHIRAAMQTNIRPIDYAVVNGDFKVHRFTYYEFSIAYDLFNFNKK